MCCPCGPNTILLVLCGWGFFSVQSIWTSVAVEQGDLLFTMKMGLWEKRGTDGGLCGEDGAEAGAAWTPLPLGNSPRCTLPSLHAVPGHRLAEQGWHRPAPGQGARQRLNSADDGPHLGPFVCSGWWTHKKPPRTRAGWLPSEAVWSVGFVKAHFKLMSAGNFPGNFQPNSCFLQVLYVACRTH